MYQRQNIYIIYVIIRSTQNKKWCPCILHISKSCLQYINYILIILRCGSFLSNFISRVMCMCMMRMKKKQQIKYSNVNITWENKNIKMKAWNVDLTRVYNQCNFVCCYMIIMQNCFFRSFFLLYTKNCFRVNKLYYLPKSCWIKHLRHVKLICLCVLNIVK